MTTSDIINLGIAISTALGVLVSLRISVLTLRQSSKQAKESREMNEKMLEESTRPFLHLFIRTNYSVNDCGRLVLKNFGSSAAKITKVQVPNISLMPQIDEVGDPKPFSSIVNSIFPPGYEIETAYEYTIAKNLPFYEMKIEYSSGTHSYQDVLPVYFKQHDGVVHQGPYKGHKIGEYISESLQVIAQSLHSKV